MVMEGPGCAGCDPLCRECTLRFLVDTGAFLTVVPRDVLSRLKVRPIREETVQFAGGRKARWKVGEARLDIDGRSVTTLVLFGKKGTQPLLGAYSIEGLGVLVDSRRRRFIPMPVVIVAALGLSSKIQWPEVATTRRAASFPLWMQSDALKRAESRQRFSSGGGTTQPQGPSGGGGTGKASRGKCSIRGMKPLQNCISEDW